MAWDVITPRDYHRVRLIEVPVEDLSEREIALLIHRITLTPGTLTCGLTEDGRYLLVHEMYGASRGLAARLRKPVDLLRGRP
jgi:multicomponent K+:H+ antiporter subunit E